MSYHFIWLALLLALHLAAVCRVLLNSEINADARTSWLLLIMFLPVVGIALYLFLGEPWIARGFRRRAQQMATVRERHHADASGLANLPERYRPAFSTCEHIAAYPVMDGNRATLAADSDSAIDAMAADFDAARETIDVSFYIWLTDRNGLKIVEALKRAAARGVVCRIIVDAFGSRDLIRSPHWAAMEASGAKLCVSLRPSVGLSWRSISRPDLRNHRKIVVIDSRITYCGSQNCADPQFLVKAKFAPWVDIMLRLTGPVVRQNQSLFAEDWQIEQGEDIRSIPDEPLSPPASGGFPAIAFGTGPMSPKGSMSDVFVALLGSADREVVISTPYFAPDLPLLAAILSCARRGVATTLFLPARNDSAVIAAISRAHYARLIAAGVTLREYHGGLLHAKTLVVDRSVALVGSANMDYRSLYLNFENNVLLYSQEVSSLIHERQMAYLKSSTTVSAQAVRSRSSVRVAFDNLLGLLAPIY